MCAGPVMMSFGIACLTMVHRQRQALSLAVSNNHTLIGGTGAVTAVANHWTCGPGASSGGVAMGVCVRVHRLIYTSVGRSVTVACMHVLQC